MVSVEKEVKVMTGEVVAITSWNGGTVAVTTTYGLYSVYRSAEIVEITLLAIFEKEDK
jgi:uncharacterized protein Veg